MRDLALEQIKLPADVSRMLSFIPVLKELRDSSKLWIMHMIAGTENLLKGTLTLQANFLPLMHLKIIRITVKTVCPNSFYIKRYLQKTKYLQWPWGSKKCYIGSKKHCKRNREALLLSILVLLHQDPKSIAVSKCNTLGIRCNAFRILQHSQLTC